MGRETQRRLALLAIVGVLAVAWTIALNPPAVTSVALASSIHEAVAVQNARVAPCPFPASLRSAFEAAAFDASLPPALLYAVAQVESSMHEDAESSAGANDAMARDTKRDRVFCARAGDCAHRVPLADAGGERGVGFDPFPSSAKAVD